MNAISDAVVREDLAALEAILSGKIVAKGIGEESELTIQEQLRNQNLQGKTPLHLAAVAKMGGATAMMRLLLDAGSDVSARDHVSRTALLMMIQQVKDTKILRAKVLLKYGVDVNASDIYGATALSATWERAEDPDSQPLLLLLLDNGADPNQRMETKQEESTTLLHWAVKRENRRLVNKLIQCGADPNSKNSKGQTPLHFAAGNYGSGLSIMMVLLEAGGADPCVVEENGMTPLMVVCSLKHSFLERIDVLLDYVAKPKTLYINAHDKAGWSALMHVSKTMYGATKALHLLELGADPFQRDNTDGSTILMNSVKTAYSGVALQVIGKLLRAGVDPNLSDRLGRTALHRASINKAPPVQVICLLLCHGADPSKQDRAGYFPLTLACLQNDPSKVFVLLKAMVGQGSVS